jgi:predicted glycoside hydrolase/deacetylase ChbG (UPF0249 family)
LRVVLNADDFGASADTASSTVECLENGLLTSATIMIGMPETGSAIELARTRPECSFGVHLHLVGDGDERPLCDPSLVPGLVDGDGLLLRTNVVRVRALTGRLPVDEVAREVTAQISHVRDNGVEVTHVDSHRHVHKLPAVREALERVLPGLGIRRVRAVQDVYLRRPVTSPTFWLGGTWQRALAKSFLTTDHFFMPTSAHDVGWHAELLARMERLRGATLEVGVHPGTDGWRDAERAGLEAFAPAARAAGHQLVTWRDIGRP